MLESFKSRKQPTSMGCFESDGVTRWRIEVADDKGGGAYSQVDFLSLEIWLGIFLYFDKPVKVLPGNDRNLTSKPRVLQKILWHNLCMHQATNNLFFEHIRPFHLVIPKDPKFQMLPHVRAKTYLCQHPGLYKTLWVYTVFCAFHPHTKYLPATQVLTYH